MQHHPIVLGGPGSAPAPLPQYQLTPSEVSYALPIEGREFLVKWYAKLASSVTGHGLKLMQSGDSLTANRPLSDTVFPLLRARGLTQLQLITHGYKHWFLIL